MLPDKTLHFTLDHKLARGLYNTDDIIYIGLCNNLSYHGFSIGKGNVYFRKILARAVLEVSNVNKRKWITEIHNQGLG